MTDSILRAGALSGQVALVTGGSRGIGRAIVEQLAAEGAAVAFFYRSRHAAAAEVVDAAKAAGQRVEGEAVDVREAAAVDAAVRGVVQRFGRLDILVNNSGVVHDGMLGLLADRELGDLLASNIGGALHVTRAVVGHLVAKRAGRIVTVTSVAARKGGRGQTVYAATKGALEAFTRALAVELAPRGIAVNAVAPGIIDTDMTRAVQSRAGTALTDRILLRRLGTAAEVAHAVAFLASPYASYITGQVLTVDGGFKME